MISTVKNPNHTGIQKLPMLKTVPAPGPTVPPVPGRSTSKLVSQIPDPSRDDVRLTQKDLDDVTMTWRWAIFGIATPKGWKNHETHRSKSHLFSGETNGCSILVGGLYMKLE